MTKLEEKIRAKSFVVTTELTPPKGTDLTELFAKADALKGYADAINLTESPRARMAVEPKAVARLLIERGVEPIVQVTARDRNRIAIQADLLGASLLGVGNFLFMTGDNPKNGDHPDAKGVFDLTTLEMLAAARGLRDGHDMAGNELKGRRLRFSAPPAIRARRTWRSRSRTPGARSMPVRSSCRRRRFMTPTCWRAFSIPRSSATLRCWRG